MGTLRRVPFLCEVSHDLSRVEGAGYFHHRVFLPEPLQLFALMLELFFVVIWRIAPTADQPIETDLASVAGDQFAFSATRLETQQFVSDGYLLG